MRASDLLVQCLEREGVRYVFGIPGEETMDINDSLALSSVTFIPTRHEQGAAPGFFWTRGLPPGQNSWHHLFLELRARFRARRMEHGR